MIKAELQELTEYRVVIEEQCFSIKKFDDEEFNEVNCLKRIIKSLLQKDVNEFLEVSKTFKKEENYKEEEVDNINERMNKI